MIYSDTITFIQLNQQSPVTLRHLLASLISQFIVSNSCGSALTSVPAGKTTKSALWSIIQALIQYLKQHVSFF